MSSGAFKELFQKHPSNPILTVKDWPYPVTMTYNAAATKVGKKTLLLVRVDDRTCTAHLSVATSDNGVSGWQVQPEPALVPSPDHPEEEWGLEDPRITRIDELDCWVVAYVGSSDGGPVVSLATTKDFKTFERLGAVMAPDNKDAALFPRRIGGRWAMLHRPVSSILGTVANIWIAYSPDLRYWGENKLVMRASGGWKWDGWKIGLNPEPLETPEGWLICYHGVRATASGNTYRMGLALLDLEDPSRVIRRCKDWLIAPSEEYERRGEVENTVFSCGWTVEGDELRLYYSGADTCVALATASMKEVMAFMMKCPGDA